MADSLLIMLTFLAAAAGLTAIGMFVRDLVAQPADRPKLVLRPPTPKPDKAELETIDGQLSSWLHRVAVEGRLSFGPVSVALIIFLAGFTLAALLYVWREDNIAALFGLLIGAGLAIVGFEIYRSRQVNAVLQQLPSVIDQLARAVKAGESLDQALVVVSDKLKEPLGPELRQVCRQVQMGLPVPTALQSLHNRIPLLDIQMLVSTLSVHREVGGNLVVTLERMAQMLRQRLSFRRQVQATTAAGRFAAMFLVLVTPMVFLYFYFFRNQAIMPVFEDAVGLAMLTVVLVLEVIGLAWVWSVIRLKY
ncbi:MAG: type II secretion system F family protein [Planctomycetaceae bacterium]|nr:type II secretion system F family protein [Planctomycetaceae bacterium]